jgi:threonine/homoserine/homoserine lactone efflux protein
LGIAFLIKGLLIGLSIAAPLGPIGLLCMNRTHAAGPLVGFTCGLGAATAEALHALAGMIALAAIAQWIVEDPLALRVAGGIFLVYLGARTFMRPSMILPPAGKGPAPQANGAQAAFLSTFRLTLANPVTVLGFAAMFAGLGAAPGRLISADTAAAVLILGVFLGSILWWLVLSSLIGRLRPHIGVHTLTLINRLCGTVLTAFGLYAIATLLPLL